MQPFPHHYAVVAKAETQSDVALEGERLPPIASAPPTEFGGPGDRWSPETLLVAAVADCFILTFRAIAGASITANADASAHVSFAGIPLASPMWR